MTVEFEIKSGNGNGRTAAVSDIGQLIVGAFSDDETEFRELAEDDTAYNFYEARDKERFKITGMVLKADKQVSTTVDATVVLYESDAPDSTTVDRVLFQVAMVSGDSLVITPINVLVNVGKFVNGKTDDDDIHVTIMGHFRPE